MNNPGTHQTSLFGMADYVAALDTICTLARSNLFIFDRDFINIGFDSPGRIELLSRFLLSSPKNRLLLLAHDTQPLSQYCPRLITLLRQFSHNMYVYQTPKNLQHLAEPFAVADESGYARRFHFDDKRGILATDDGAEAYRIKSRFMEMWSSSQPHISTASINL